MSAFSRQQLVVALALGTAALAASPAVAQELIEINVTVSNSCEVTGEPIQLSTYFRGQSEDLTGEGALNYQSCPVGTVIKLGDGQYGNNGARNLNSSGNILEYELFQDAALSAAWDTDGYELADGAPVDGDIPVHVRIAGGENVPAGDYSDSVQINVTF